MAKGGPIRVLHIVGGLERGGTETWLRNVARASDTNRVQMDFLVHGEHRGAYEPELACLGCGIHRCSPPRNLVRYARELVGVLAREGPYDVVHAHVQHFNGLALLAAGIAGVGVRISHSHLATTKADSRFPRSLYTKTMKCLIRRASTLRLAASQAAAEALFGLSWRQDARCELLFCGVDLAPFEKIPSRATARAEFGISPSALVIGHVGRMVAQKNQGFAIEVAGEVVRRRPDTKLLLVGDGPDRAELVRRAVDIGIPKNVHFIGGREDIPYVLAAMDVFIFPSLFEGLGLAGVEAQAAGLPVIVSDVVPSEMDIVPNAVRRLALNASVATWADAVLDVAHGYANRSDALQWIQGTPFDVRRSTSDLMDVYEHACAGAKAGRVCSGSSSITTPR